MISERNFSIVVGAAFLALFVPTLAPNIKPANRSLQLLLCHGLACPRGLNGTVQRRETPDAIKTVHKDKPHRV